MSLFDIVLADSIGADADYAEATQAAAHAVEQLEVE